MSLDLFRVIGGIDVVNEALTSNANILTGTGTPGGDGNAQDAAPIGSIYLRVDSNATVGEENLQVYWKYRTTQNSVDDWKIIADKNYVDAIAQGLSWREPVEVLDDTSTSLPVGTAGNPINVDGVSITDGNRVLFSSITTGSPSYPERNIFIYDQSSGTFVEDTNQETDGDAVLVRQGSHAEQQWVYDGTNWVQFGSVASNLELQFIRDFIGKTGSGAEFPSYSSTNVVTSGNNLEIAIGSLDAMIGDGVITNDNIDGSPAAYALSDDLTNGGGTLDLTNALNELNNAIGNRTYTNDSVVTDGETIAESIDALDIAVGDLINESLVVTGTTTAGVPTPVDTLATPGDATQVKWLIQMRDTTIPANRRAIEIHAFTDGTNVDHTKYSVLKLGSPIAGIDVTIDVSGGNIRLVVNSTNGVDFVVKRIGYTTF